MFVSMIFIRALFFCLVPFTKLDEGFTVRRAIAAEEK